MTPNRISLSLGLALLCHALLSAAVEPQDDECVDLQGLPPGLYVTVDQNQVYLIKDGKMVELDPGEAAYANETDLACLKIPPRILDWPCDTAEALTRQMAPTYTVDQLPAIDGVREVARRYLKENQAIGPQIEWLNGETHGTFPAVELEELDTSAYWYLPGSDDPFASPKRPRAQLVSLFWATQQAVVDTNTLTALEIEHPDGEIPVVFVFHSDREVPVSYFGPNPSLETVTNAFLEDGVQLAPVPVWYVGDHHLAVPLAELEALFDIPALDQISDGRRAALSAELEAYGFSHKPLSVSVMAESGMILLDQPERVRVAASMGFDSIPVVLFYYSGTSHLEACGVPLPQVSVVGAAAAVDTPGLPPPQQLPPPERNPSDS